jgi:histidyl-tRNA synthetase
MAADSEVMSLIYTALKRLGFQDFTIKYNNRKLLTGLGIYSGVPEAQLPSLYRSIDKTDKIGLDGVAEELRKSGLAEDTVRKMVRVLSFDGAGDTSRRLAALGKLREEIDDIAIAQEGISELEEITKLADALGVDTANSAMDFTMVRGLGYYTGPIFETVITQPDNLGSVQGGGRYDELIGRFRGQSLPTTGISLGIERIIDLLTMLNLYPDWVMRGTVVQVLVATFSEATQTDTLKLAQELREAGIKAEAWLDPRKNIGKQIGYADGKGIPLVVISGPDEIARGEVQLKRLADGEERLVPRTAMASEVLRLLS